jgi:ABC-type multidrug transport system fused ATPase/permease subunit
MGTINSPARKIWSLLAPTERRSAVVLLGLMLIGMVLETLSVGLVIPAIALMTQSDYATKFPVLQSVLAKIGNPSQQALVVIGVIALVVVYVIKNLFLGFFAWRQNSFTFGLMEQFSQRLLTIYLRQPYTFHLQRNSAQLMRNVFTEVDLFTGNVVTPMMLLLGESLIICGLAALLLSIEPIGVLIVAGVIITASWVFNRLTRPFIARWGALRQHHAGLRFQHLQQGLSGVKDIKLLGRESEFLRQFRTHNEHYARVGRLQNTLLQFPRLWLEVLAIGGLAMLVLTMLAQGSKLSAVMPMLGLFAAAAFRLMPSISRVLGAFQSLRYGLPVIDTLHVELNLAAPAPGTRHGPVLPFREMLELCQVTYSYHGAPAPAISELSLAVHRGETVGFIGASGAGKSTLVDILLGLLTPDSGEVRVDGADIQADLRGWQDQIGYVPQAIFLTDDTLRRNVAFGLPNDQIDESAVWHAVKAAQLEEFVHSLPDGLETLVGERGVRLSGGQRQRIGIARALYHDPAVLVLDEATSALDTATERSVMEAVRALQGSKTIFIVAHRLSTVQDCDRLYRLEKGRVIDEGKPDAILASTLGALPDFEHSGREQQDQATLNAPHRKTYAQ